MQATRFPKSIVSPPTKSSLLSCDLGWQELLTSHSESEEAEDLTAIGVARSALYPKGRNEVQVGGKHYAGMPLTMHSLLLGQGLSLSASRLRVIYFTAFWQHFQKHRVRIVAHSCSREFFLGKGQSS